MRIVASTADLQKLVQELTGAPYLALDTEFMRDQTYWPKLCLIQVYLDVPYAALTLSSPSSPRKFT